MKKLIMLVYVLQLLTAQCTMNEVTLALIPIHKMKDHNGNISPTYISSKHAAENDNSQQKFLTTELIPQDERNLYTRKIAMLTPLKKRFQRDTENKEKIKLMSIDLSALGPLKSQDEFSDESWVSKPKSLEVDVSILGQNIQNEQLSTGSTTNFPSPLSFLPREKTVQVPETLWQPTEKDEFINRIVPHTVSNEILNDIRNDVIMFPFLQFLLAPLGIYPLLKLPSHFINNHLRNPVMKDNIFKQFNQLHINSKPDALSDFIENESVTKKMKSKSQTDLQNLSAKGNFLSNTPNVKHKDFVKKKESLVKDWGIDGYLSKVSKTAHEERKRNLKRHIQMKKHKKYDRSYRNFLLFNKWKSIKQNNIKQKKRSFGEWLEKIFLFQHRPQFITTMVGKNIPIKKNVFLSQGWGPGGGHLKANSSKNHRKMESQISITSPVKEHIQLESQHFPPINFGKHWRAGHLLGPYW
ncbi:uncharacterized protein LOC111087777 [Limulus polyphemus]|uniref:Uncharacterized protein LOC111087777 n=1 Tax=Limulus polyphemus TaxID=6850 RepID=A0ABM1T615_LIMPO|nr:uncharacterized protein LOC111087777 [Limulus polyphemus]